MESYKEQFIEIMEYLHNRPVDGKVVINDELYQKIVEYRRTYGSVIC